MSKTQVYGVTLTTPASWHHVIATRQCRVIVRATSRRRAVEAINEAGGFNLTESWLAKYGSTTGNKDELRVTDQIGAVYACLDAVSAATAHYHRMSGPFEELGRERKAAKLALVLKDARATSKEARDIANYVRMAQRAERAAGVNPASADTWERVAELLTGR